jgi:hypothetical protein
MKKDNRKDKKMDHMDMGFAGAKHPKKKFAAESKVKKLVKR